MGSLYGYESAIEHGNSMMDSVQQYNTGALLNNMRVAREVANASQQYQTQLNQLKNTFLQKHIVEGIDGIHSAGSFLNNAYNYRKEGQKFGSHGLFLRAQPAIARARLTGGVEPTSVNDFLDQRPELKPGYVNSGALPENAMGLSNQTIGQRIRNLAGITKQPAPVPATQPSEPVGSAAQVTPVTQASPQESVATQGPAEPPAEDAVARPPGRAEPSASPRPNQVSDNIEQTRNPRTPTLEATPESPEPDVNTTAGAKAGGVAEEAEGVTKGVLGKYGGKLLGSAGGLLAGGEDIINAIHGSQGFDAIQGDNWEEKTANIGTMVGTALDLAGTTVPILEPIGALVGLASSIFGDIGEKKDEEEQKQAIKPQPVQDTPQPLKGAQVISQEGLIGKVASQ